MDTPIHLDRVTPGYWRVSLNNPPLNLFDPAMRFALQDLITVLEDDRQVKVVVFDSANPRYFISHIDLANRDQIEDRPGPTGLASWPDFTLRISRAPFIAIASVRGRARGVGSEFIQAMDLRFASREQAVLSQPEIGFGFIPGGGGLERLWRIVGKARALEIIVSGDDYDADTAELYGWVNRAVPDDQLDVYVEDLARRIDTFDREAIRAVKEILNAYDPPVDQTQLLASNARFLELLSQPSAQARVRALQARGLQTDGELELGLGALVADAAVSR